MRIAEDSWHAREKRGLSNFDQAGKPNLPKRGLSPPGFSGTTGSFPTVVGGERVLELPGHEIKPRKWS
jgi:hypothetical protein